MSIALCRGFVLSYAGHTATQRLHPVQTPVATWIVNLLPLYSLPRYSTDLKVAGAPASAVGTYDFARIAACGHTIAHLLHRMQMVGSQTGICAAMLRSSHCAVPVGHVPSTGNALTGRRSPLPSSITAVTRRMKSG